MYFLLIFCTAVWRVWMLVETLSIRGHLLTPRLTQSPQSSQPPAPLRVYGGTPDTLNQYPYIVAVVDEILLGKRLTLFRKCTGTLIRPNWVITTANLGISAKFIQYGNMSVKPDMTGEVSRVLNIVVHPRFQIIHLGLGNSNDVALLRVSPVMLNSYGRLSAVDYMTLAGLSVKYAGYGLAMFGKTDVEVHNTQVLLVGEGVVATCPPDRPAARSYVCVFMSCREPQTAMHGDYGSPLFFDGRIVAIMNAVSGDGYIIIHTEWTPISLHITWIRQVLAKKYD